MRDNSDNVPASEPTRITLEPEKLLMLNGIEGATDLANTIKIGTKPGKKPSLRPVL